ncbi:MAG TPA: dihydrodipicolinate synthase family protein [Gemmatimonadaceae bacterium]|nr:dihydrodipicolinate synthase family protein [Gemmatimonadaceae bacterium]
MRQLSGILAPVITNFHPRTEDVSAARFAATVRACIAAGLDGVVVAGSTGEAALLGEDERRVLIEAARAEVPDGRWLLAGVGAESTRLTVQRARDAAERGADAVLVVAPHYYVAQMTGAAVRAHYERVADESPLPVVLYNIPKYMHYRLEPELVAALARHGNVIGIKDSSGDLELTAAYLAAQDDGFSVLTGNGGQVRAALGRGARGGILAMALFAVELTLAVVESLRAGDAAAADEAQARLAPLAREIVGALGVPGVKAAMDEVGLDGGTVRLPLLPLGPAERARVAELLRGAKEPAGAR